MSVAEERVAGFTSAGQSPAAVTAPAQASTLPPTNNPTQNHIASPSPLSDTLANHPRPLESDSTSSSTLTRPTQRQNSLQHSRVAPQTSVSPNSAPDSQGASSRRPVALVDDQTNHHAPTNSTSASASAPATTATAALGSNSKTTTSSPPPAGSSNNDIITSSPPALQAAPHDRLQRSATYPSVSPRDTTEAQSTSQPHDFVSSTIRRAPASRSSLGVETLDGPPLSLKTQRAQAPEGSSSAGTSPTTLSPRDSGGQRELLLLKSLASSSPPDETRRASTHRPPVSYKPPANPVSAQNANATPVRVPPIRSFRSSGSGNSLNLDMNNGRSSYDMGQESPSDPNNYDRTLRALEGRQISDMLQMTPPTSARNESFDGDDGGDVFLKIAREEDARRHANEDPHDETRSSVSRVYRTHRRPLSTNVASYQPKSPPFMGRRLSDQNDNNRPRLDDERASEVTRSMTQRLYTSNHKASSVHPGGEDNYRSRPSSTALRASPLTPRSQAYQQDSGSENPIHKRRRSSVTDHNTTPPASRSASYKPANGHAHKQSYNSSPLVRSFDFNNQSHQHGGSGQPVEGTESTASTTAPSTVWDELDDLKSRIHRLELTGKLPSTSAAAVSRMSDERPPTATTTVTTMSSSPKRNGGGAQQNDTTSTTSSQKEAYPILHSALTKSRPFLSPDIFRTLEMAANEAISLSSMMGQPGQPGPISSGASTIASGTTTTDRQLRRKADSVCRSLTELAVALGEDVAHSKPASSTQTQKPSEARSQKQYHPSGHSQVSSAEDRSLIQYHPSTKSQISQSDSPSTPTISKTFSGLHSRRPSAVTEQNLPNPNTSPSRVRSKFEERRNTILAGSALPSPRASGSTPTTPQEGTAQRRSSLLISRTRRAVTEEPEEQPGRRSSFMLGRTRRGGTEEPEEGRQTSLLRSRRGTVGEGDEDTGRFNAPSRAYTEVNATRGSNRQYTEVASSARAPTREYAPQPLAQSTMPQESPSALPTALPRRRFVSTNTTTTSRLPPPPSQSALPTRKYLERSPAPAAERDPTEFAPQPQEDRRQRYHSLGQSMSLNRSGSLNTRRQNRDSTITNSSTTASTGAYR